MIAHTFRAPRFSDALEQIKRELGARAMIVSSKHVAAGETFDEPYVEVQALAPDDADRHEAMLGTAGSSRTNHALERRLVERGVPLDLAQTLAGRVGQRVTLSSGAELSEQAKLADALKGYLPFCRPGAGHGARVVALVGPTGVGKTTTLAKLAARAALEDHRRVALICLDHYRIGGAEQLEIYANLIGIPMRAAHDTRSLIAALTALESAELVLIDTAGRSPRDQEALDAMAALFSAAGEPVDVMLCLETARRDAELKATIETFAQFRPHALIMTKLDEAVVHGGIAMAAHLSRIPLAYFTTGQRVPEDLEAALPQRLAQLLCERNPKEIVYS